MNFLKPDTISQIEGIKKSKFVTSIDEFVKGIKTAISTKFTALGTALKNTKISDIKKYSSCFKVNSIKGVVFIDSIEKNKFKKSEMLYNILKSFIY